MHAGPHASRPAVSRFGRRDESCLTLPAPGDLQPSSFGGNIRADSGDIVADPQLNQPQELEALRQRQRDLQARLLTADPHSQDSARLEAILQMVRWQIETMQALAQNPILHRYDVRRHTRRPPPPQPETASAPQVEST